MTKSQLGINTSQLENVSSIVKNKNQNNSSKNHSNKTLMVIDHLSNAKRLLSNKLNSSRLVFNISLNLKFNLKSFCFFKTS